MKKRILPILLISISLLSLISCNPNAKEMEEGSVNYYIYPYVKFALSPSLTYYEASIVDGAKLTSVLIPGYHHTDFGPMPVKAFKGFENPEDAVNLKTVYIDINVDKIADDAFEYAENLERIIVTGAEEGSNWTKLPPSLKRKGYHFEGWKVGEIIYDGESTILIDLDTPVAQPYFVELEHYDAVSPTCTESGSIEHWKCPECGKFFTDDRAENSVTSVSVSPLGHLFPLIHVDRIEPTCQKEGNVEYWRCDRCMGIFSDMGGTVPLDSFILDKVDHQSDGDPHASAAVHSHACRWCGTAMDEEEHVLSEWIIDTPATEHTKGLRHADCSVCSYRKTVEIPEHDHFDYEPAEKVKHDATCLEGAYYIEKCGNPECGEVLKVLIEDEPALGHRGTYHGLVDSTCTETGTLAHIWCDVCDAPYENRWSEVPMETIIVPLKPHEYSTIWTVGEDTHYHLCINCGVAKSGETESVYRNVVGDRYLKYSSTCQHANQYIESCECGKEGTEIFESGEIGEHSYTKYVPFTYQYHQKACEWCDALLPNSYENHEFDEHKVCSKCGYVFVGSDGGFDVIIVDKSPKGHIELINDEGTSKTFIFVNEKSKHPPTKLEWYVEGVLIRTDDVYGVGDYSEYVFTASTQFPMSYSVMCRYSNESSAGSSTMSVLGGDSQRN